MIDSPEWVIFSSAPVALRCTRMSLDRASRVRGTRAPDLAILVLLSSETYEIWSVITQLKSRTMCSEVGHTSDGIALDLDVWAEHLANQGLETAEFDDEKLVVG